MTAAAPTRPVDATAAEPVATPPPEAQPATTAIDYDPEAIAAYYLNRPFEVWSRFLQIFWPLFSFVVGLWWDGRTGQARTRRARRAEQLREILTDLGPAYIKIGQALSTRPDLVPAYFLEELTKLQDQLPPFPNAIAYAFIEEELGHSWQEIYAELSERPVSAASLGQVYRGRLHSGEEVAVKVQRPGLAERITLDLYIGRGLAAFLMRNVKLVRSNLVAIADEFGRRIYEEMDYNHEADNAERFARLYGNGPDIYVPRIYRQFTRRRVLTMEWIQGTKLTELKAIEAQGISPEHLIEIGVQCSLRQLLDNGFFHADPHPGNLLAMPDGRLAYLDFGMMSKIETYQRHGLIEAVVHLANRDFEALSQDYVKLEFLAPDTDLEPIIPALQAVFAAAEGQSITELDFKDMTDQLSDVMYRFPFRVPPYYALIIRSLVTLEGIAFNVDPNFKVLSRAYPFIARQILVEPSPELRSALRELLYKDGQLRWHRLENLLTNASQSEDYDPDELLRQTLEFLFSERGIDLRRRLVRELVDGIDRTGQQLLEDLKQRLERQLGLRPPVGTREAAQPNAIEELLRILDLLRRSPQFDPLRLAQILPEVLFRRELAEMGRDVALGLGEKLLVRFIRDVLAAPPGRPVIAA